MKTARLARAVAHGHGVHLFGADGRHRQVHFGRHAGPRLFESPEPSVLRPTPRHLPVPLGVPVLPPAFVLKYA